MECPFCKYDNPAGATHCGLCYEVFSRSAAETYQRILQREKMQRQRAETMPSNALSALAQAHWKKPFTAAANFSLSHPWIIGASALVLLLAAALDFLAAPSVRLSLYGARPDYDF